MRSTKMLQLVSGVVALAGVWAGPALAADAPACCKDPNAACCKDPKAACCEGQHNAPGAKPDGMHDKGDACCKHDKDEKGGACCKDGKSCGEGGCHCEGGACDHEGGEHHGMDMHGMDMHGHDGMGMHMGMGMGMHGNHWMGPEIRYMPSSLASAGSNGNQYLVLGGGGQMGGDGVFSMGFGHNLAIQLFNPNPAVGSWVAPYGGLLPRLGFGMGQARLDVGVLGGFGVMARTIGQPGMNASFLDARFQWVVEPRIELGMRGEHHGIALVGTYLLTPNPNDLGGLSIGLRATFGGHHGW